MSAKMTAYDTIIQGGTVVTAADSVAALGTIAVGADVDIAIWDADKEVTITWDALHDDVGNTANEGMTIKGLAGHGAETRPGGGGGGRRVEGGSAAQALSSPRAVPRRRSPSDA